MAIPTWKDIKDYPYLAILELLIILAILAVMGATFAVSFALIPVITSALALSLLPQLMITLIIFSPVIASALLLIHFVEFNWYLVRYADSNKLITSYLPTLFFTILLGPGIEFEMVHKTIKRETAHKEKFGKAGEAFFAWWMIYGVFTGLTSLSLGIYLSQAILPALISSVVAATNLPYGVVALFGVLAAGVLIMLTHQLLTLPFRLVDLALWARLWQKEQGCRNLFFRIFQIGLTVTGMALAAYASYIVFPMIMKSLLPLLPATTASFTAVLICTGLVVLVMSALLTVANVLGELTRRGANLGSDKNSLLTAYFYRADDELRRWISPELTTSQELRPLTVSSGGERTPVSRPNGAYQPSQTRAGL